MLSITPTKAAREPTITEADAILDIDPVFLEPDPDLTVEQDADDKELRSAFAAFSKPARQTAVAELLEDRLVTLLTCFIQINPTPSDEQVHCLAKAIGLAKEALEQIIYQMLSEALGQDGDLDTEIDLEDMDLEEEDDELMASVDQVLALKPAFDEDRGYFEQGPTGDGATRSIITDPIDTDEKQANDGMPDEHVVRIKQAEAEKLRRADTL